MSNLSLKKTIVDTKTGEITSFQEKIIKENNNFIMFFRNEMHSLQKIAQEDGAALSVLMLLTEHMDQTNSLVVSRDTISEILGLSVPTIDRKLKFLKERNFIQVVKSGTSNIYTINSKIAWTTYSNQKQYSKFTSNILVSKTEQNVKIKKSKIKQIDVNSKHK